MNQATACDPGGQINNSAGYKFRYRIDKPKSKRVLTRYDLYAASFQSISIVCVDCGEV